MSFLEIILVGVMTLLVAAPFGIAYRSKDQTLFWNPLTLFATVFAYYFVVGPLISVAFHHTFAYGMDLRDMMGNAWMAGILGLGSIYAGFAFKVRPYRTKLVEKLGAPLRKRLWTNYALLAGLGLVGFLYCAYVSGQSLADLLQPFHQSAEEAGNAEREGLAAGNYVFLLINLFIPASCLLAVLTHGKPLKQRIWIVGLPVLAVALFYMSVAFRHRIVTLILSLAATIYLLQRKRPAPATLLVGAAGIVLLSGFIVLTRSYGRGLDLSQLQNLSLLEVFLGGFGDAGTFFTMGLVIDSFPSVVPYVGLDPFWIALTIPVPRALWPDKPYAVFLDYFEFITGTRGQAVPVTGEHYMMAGWFGVILGGIVLGLIYRRFWEFYRANPRNPFVVTMYAVAWALIFPVVNRGYLAQTLMEFFFDLLPLVILFLISRKAMLAPATRARQRASVSSQNTAPLVPTTN